MAAYQMRSPRAQTILTGAPLQGSHHIRMIRETQIIIAAEVDQSPPVTDDISPLRAFDRQTAAIKPLLVNRLQPFAYTITPTHAKCASVLRRVIEACHFETQPLKQGLIGIGDRVICSQQPLTIEDGIGARHKTQGLHFITHLAASCGQTNP